MKIFYSPECLAYSHPGHPEAPVRVESAYYYLKEKKFEFIEPAPCSDEDVLLAHTAELLESVRKENFFDFDTPAFPGIFNIAKLSAGSAIKAALHCLATGEKAFSLMRPPGHHATKRKLGGFCYFNNIAIASLKAQQKIKKVAIVDFDCHHGNGTEDIFIGNKNVMYLSLHQSPLYPGTGLSSRENCINYPLPAQTSPGEYLSVLEQGLEKVRGFAPDLLAVSAGFDTYKLDPITSFSLEKETYTDIGRRLADLQTPTFSILEGGYSKELDECIYNFLTGLEE